LNFTILTNKTIIEKRYQEYLETFQSVPFVRIENESVNKQDFFSVNEYLKKNRNIKELKYSFIHQFDLFWFTQQF